MQKSQVACTSFFDFYFINRFLHRKKLPYHPTKSDFTENASRFQMMHLPYGKYEGKKWLKPSFNHFYSL
jgi:hypothetical protein